MPVAPGDLERARGGARQPVRVRGRGEGIALGVGVMVTGAESACPVRVWAMTVAEPRAPESVATPVRRSTRTIAESVDVNATGTCDMVLSLESITTAVNTQPVSVRQ